MSLKNLLLSVFLFSQGLFTLSQNYSVYFEKPHPEAGKVKDADFIQGQYQDTSLHQATWIFNEKGIYTSEVIPLKIPKAEVRESSKYNVSNGYIFGVKDNDSLPYIMQGDAYLVGIENLRLQADWKNKESENEVYMNDQSLYLHFKEGDYYSIIKIEQKVNTLVFYEFHYEAHTEQLKSLKKTDEEKINSMPTLILNPKSKEWEEYNLESYFKPYMRLYRL